MNKFKQIISSHKMVPLKMILITYIAWFIYAAIVDEPFVWFDNAVLMFGVFVIYIIFSLIASSLSFNKNKDPIYFLNDRINESAINMVEYYESMDGRDKPEEVRIRRETIARLLDAAGTISSDETSRKIYNKK